MEKCSLCTESPRKTVKTQEEEVKESIQKNKINLKKKFQLNLPFKVGN